MSRLREPRHHPAQPTACAESPGPSSTRSRSTNARIPRTIMALAEAGLPRGQEPNPARRAHPEPDSGQPRLGCAASLGATLEGASLGATLEGASLGATRESASLGVSWCWARRFLPKRSCPASVTGAARSRGMRHPRARGRGARRPQSRRRRSRRPSRTNATVRGGSLSGALRSRTPSRSC